MDSTQKLDIRNIVSYPKIYGYNESVIASGYPMKKQKPEGIDVVTTQDVKRAKTLSSMAIGSGHDNFLKGIIVQFNLTLSKHTWLEALRYHWFEPVSSQSTMHCLAKMEVEYMPWTDKGIMEAFQKVLDTYRENPSEENWLALIYSYPSGLQLTARMTTNFQQLKTIYQQRQTHRIPEWRLFCQWIKSLFHQYDLEGALE